jgi:hypothetical protein
MTDQEQEFVGVTLTLNPSFLEEYGEEGVRAYCAAVDEVAARSGDLAPSELAVLLRSRLDASGVVLPDISYDRTAEQLTEGAGGPLSVILTDGTVIFGPGPRPAPDIHVGDPGHPDRPTYS